MDKTCLNCNKSCYVSPSRSHIKNCSYECNKAWRKTNSIQRKPLSTCLCGCKNTVKSHRAKYVFGHHPQPKIRSGLFESGHKTNLGRKFGKEFREKLSKANLGRKSKYSGEKHWNWKGGITKTSNERVKFLKYQVPKVLKRDNYTCQICNQYSGYLHVDHIERWADRPDLRFDLNNCRTVCRACHYYITFKRKMPIDSKWGLTSVMTRKRG